MYTCSIEKVPQSTYLEAHEFHPKCTWHSQNECQQQYSYNSVF